MSSLKPIEKRGFEDLFNMASGFVLDFSNASFAQLFEDVVGMDIYDRKYEFNGDSKAKRLRAFWEVAPDDVVGKFSMNYWMLGNTSTQKTLATFATRNAEKRHSDCEDSKRQKNLKARKSF